ncbi:MAG: metal ABC transporter ATP-binding protein [Vulcanimicrobiaceae bacterium]
MPHSNNHAVAVAIHDLSVRYDSVMALQGVELLCHSGEALGIIGPNGSGKSTLLKTIAGLLKPSAGRVDLFGKPPSAARPGSIAYVPQVEAVDFSFPATVRDVVSMARFPHLSPFAPFRKRDREIVQAALEALDITNLADRHIAHLSGGQQQRTFVARALAQEPAILLLDEPTTGVDAATSETIRTIVRERVAAGLPVLMTTHEVDDAANWFDRLAVVDRRVLAYGTPDEIAGSPIFATLFEHPHAHQFARKEAHGHA